jgi:hypothetical protein
MGLVLSQGSPNLFYATRQEIVFDGIGLDFSK